MQIESPSPSTDGSPSQKNWWLALILFSIILFLSAGMMGYNYILDKQIDTMKNEIATIDSQINIMSTDRKIVIANILNSNHIRPTIDVKGLIQEFYAAAAKSNVRFKWFSVKDDIISTTLIATEGDPLVHPDPALTIIKMIEDYSRGQKDFSLDPIASMAGDITKRTTGIQFRVVPKAAQ